jgi:hypothetical protein
MIIMSQEKPSKQSSVPPSHTHYSTVRTVLPTMIEGSGMLFAESNAMNTFHADIGGMKGDVLDLKSDLSKIKQLLLALESSASTTATSVGTEPSRFTARTSSPSA